MVVLLLGGGGGGQLVCLKGGSLTGYLEVNGFIFKRFNFSPSNFKEEGNIQTAKEKIYSNAALLFLGTP
jgi:hypothetical protein